MEYQLFREAYSILNLYLPLIELFRKLCALRILNRKNWYWAAGMKDYKQQTGGDNFKRSLINVLKVTKKILLPDNNEETKKLLLFNKHTEGNILHNFSWQHMSNSSISESSFLSFYRVLHFVVSKCFVFTCNRHKLMTIGKLDRCCEPKMIRSEWQSL